MDITLEITEYLYWVSNQKTYLKSLKYHFRYYEH